MIRMTVPYHRGLLPLLLLGIGLGGNPAIAAGTPSASNVPTKLAINKNGIKVWTYQVPNNPAFNYRATMTVNSSLNALVALANDRTAATKWVPYARQIDVIDDLDKKGNYRMRLEMNMPFPIQDRDMVIQGQLNQQSDGTVVLANKSIIDPRAPVRSGLVRVPAYEGTWQFRPLGNNQVQVTVNGYADPGGSIPIAFANLMVQQQPYEMLMNMRKLLNTGAYKNAKVFNVREVD